MTQVLDRIRNDSAPALRKNRLDDFAWATPAISQGSLFIRTYTKMYRLQAKTDAN